MFPVINPHLLDQHCFGIFLYVFGGTDKILGFDVPGDTAPYLDSRLDCGRLGFAYSFEQATQQRLIPTEYLNFIGK